MKMNACANNPCPPPPFHSKQSGMGCFSVLLVLFPAARRRRRPLQFLLLFAAFSFLLLLIYRLFLPNSSPSSLPKCADQSLALFYQLHSLAHSPRPEPLPLNWLPIQLSTQPSPPLLCPSRPGFSSPSQSPFARTLAVIHSRLDHFQRRQSLRGQFRLHAVQAFFVLSSANASREQLKRLAEEASREGDLLVLANMPEQYRLLAHKTRAWVQFLAKLECPRAPRLLLKMDDDILVNWPALANLLARTGPKPKRLVLCRTISNGQVTRNPKSKWFLSTAEFRPRPGGLGLYCQGLAILLSWDLLSVAAANLGRVQFLWMDDWYLSHALLAGSNATFVDISPHIRNVDVEEGMARDKAQIGPAADVHYPPIFGHFRPASFEHKLEEWAKIVGEKQPMEGKRKCTL